MTNTDISLSPQTCDHLDNTFPNKVLAGLLKTTP